MYCCDPVPPSPLQIIVPTADTVRYTYLVDRLLACGKHVLCVGETGTGKTLNVREGCRLPCAVWKCKR